MPTLKYSDLIAEAKQEIDEKGLVFEGKDGKTIKLRPILYLGKEELQVVQTMLNVVRDEQKDLFDRLEAIEKILVAAADRKDAFKKSLADLPPSVCTRIFEEWMEAGQMGEASA